MKVKNLSLIFILHLSSFWGSAQPLSKVLFNFRNRPAMKNAGTGYYIVDLKTGRPVAGYNPSKLMIPASALQVLYVFSALDDYGEDYFYQTDLLYRGQIKNNILFGDLILRSGGDPTFGSPLLSENTKEIIDQTIQKLMDLGIRTVKGNIYLQINGSYYPAPGSWRLQDLGNCYGAGYWGFNFSNNAYCVYLKNYAVTGKPVQVVHIKPEIYGLKLNCKVRTAAPGTGDNAYIYGSPLSYERYIFGTIPAGDSLFVIRGSIPNPPQFFIEKLKDYFRRAGIEISGVGRIEKTIKHYPDEKLIWSKISKPLIDIAKQTLNYNVNLYSEGLARLIIEKGRPADGYMNTDSINTYFHRKGIRLIDLEDGCGLSFENLIAPREFTGLLYRINKIHGTAYLRDILPQAGKDGYAKHFMDGMPYQSQVWVISGPMDKVQNAVGIFRGKSGRYYAFAIMVNQFTVSNETIQKQIQTLLSRIIKVL